MLIVHMDEPGDGGNGCGGSPDSGRQRYQSTCVPYQTLNLKPKLKPTQHVAANEQTWLIASLITTCLVSAARYLDLHELHRAFSNSKFGRQIDYLEYLSTCADFSSVPKHQKFTKAYRYVRQCCMDLRVVIVAVQAAVRTNSEPNNWCLHCCKVVTACLFQLHRSGLPYMPASVLGCLAGSIYSTFCVIWSHSTSAHSLLQTLQSSMPSCGKICSRAGMLVLNQAGKTRVVVSRRLAVMWQWTWRHLSLLKSWNH